MSWILAAAMLNALLPVKDLARLFPVSPASLADSAIEMSAPTDPSIPEDTVLALSDEGGVWEMSDQGKVKKCRCCKTCDTSVKQSALIAAAPIIYGRHADRYAVSQVHGRMTSPHERPPQS